MRIILLLGVIILSGCQPQTGARSTSSAGVKSLSEQESLQGIWYTDQDGESVQVSYTSGSLRFVNMGVLTQRSIQFLSQNSYYDYGVNETVEFSISGQEARVCYEVGCHDLRKTP